MKSKLAHERARRAALIAHNESNVLHRMRAGQVWRCWIYEPDLPWGTLPAESYFTLLAPQKGSTVPSDYELIRSRLRFGDVGKLHMAGVGLNLADLRTARAHKNYENWSNQLLFERQRPLIFDVEPFSWAPWVHNDSTHGG
jgi:hypothetical protein